MTDFIPPYQTQNISWTANAFRGAPVHGHLKQRHDDVLVHQVGVALCELGLTAEGPAPSAAHFS